MRLLRRDDTLHGHKYYESEAADAEIDSHKRIADMAADMLVEAERERDSLRVKLGDVSEKLMIAGTDNAGLRAEVERLQTQLRLMHDAHQELCDLAPAQDGETVDECFRRVIAELAQARAEVGRLKAHINRIVFEGLTDTGKRLIPSEELRAAIDAARNKP